MRFLSTASALIAALGFAASVPVESEYQAYIGFCGNDSAWHFLQYPEHQKPVNLRFRTITTSQSNEYAKKNGLFTCTPQECGYFQISRPGTNLCLGTGDHLKYVAQRPCDPTDLKQLWKTSGHAYGSFQLAQQRFDKATGGKINVCLSMVQSENLLDSAVLVDCNDANVAQLHPPAAF
jgi:hypothetical protein